MSDKGLNWTILGALDTSDKCVVAYHKPEEPFLTVGFYGIDNSDGSIKQGDKDFSPKKINRVYHRLLICKKETLKELIDTLQESYDKWEDIVNDGR